MLLLIIKKYKSISILKLTTSIGFNFDKLSQKQKEVITLLNKEAEVNGFKVEYI